MKIDKNKPNTGKFMTITVILSQELIGVIRLAIPIILVFQLYPGLTSNIPVQLACACAIGAYIYYLSYSSTKKQDAGLLYSPSGEHKQQIEQYIAACKIDPKDIQIKYAYVGEGTALNMFNTVVLDPTLCSTIKDDPEAAKVQGIFDNAISPTLPEKQKERLTKIKESLSPKAQAFIFKHELGHAFHNYTHKKLILMGIIASVATYSGILAGVMTMKALGGIAAIGIGMLTGGFVDLLLSYSSNVFFKVQEEKKADFFAARYSSCEEINAAAHFFEQHKIIMEQNEAFPGLLGKLPTTVLSGHPDGTTRVQYLRKIATKKQA